MWLSYLCGIILLIQNTYFTRVCNGVAFVFENEEQNYTDFKELVEINLTSIDELHVFIVGKKMEIPSESEGKIAARYTTRVYCWRIDNGTFDWNHVTCSIPGPIWVMTPNNKAQTIVLHNELTGIGGKAKTAPVELYKDQDVVNVHVHGLHVNPLVDDIVGVRLIPKCPEWLLNDTNVSKIASEYDCTVDESDSNTYHYVINSTHYPGSHWYHSHWHGSTALHVNGGLYGAIKMLADPNIINISKYEPDIPSKNDHFALTSFIWLATNEYCNKIMNYSSTYCGANGVNIISSAGFASPYFEKQGKFPFLFNIESLCFINCKYLNDQPTQWNHSNVTYDVSFDPEGEWSNQTTAQTFLVNGQRNPTLSVARNEWHRLRIVNTNMAYLIWQLNVGRSSDTDAYVSPSECQVWLLGNDGINFEFGPRFVYNSPYNGSVVIPPGGRADVMVICFESGLYTVIASNDDRNFTFKNAPLPSAITKIMHIYVSNDTSNYSDTSFTSNDIPCVTSPQSCTCSDWNSPGLPCEPLPYSYSPYLEDTQNEVYPDVTSECISDHDADDMNQCNVVLQRIIPGSKTQVSVNHIEFTAATPLMNISTDVVHEWLVTSNFHQFHQHIWPYQMQNEVVEGWLAQIGDWRDVVGAPGSFVARSRLVGGFDKGKLVQHCHFVPHEDHGLMAYHALMPANSVSKPIIPSSNGAPGVKTPFYTNSSTWKSASNCVEFQAISAVFTADSQTAILLYFKQFIYSNYCFFGYIPIVYFRPGHVSNAYIGISMGGAYQNDWEITDMSGNALVFTLQAKGSDTDSSYKDLADIYTSEVTLTPGNHSFTNHSNTQTMCQNTPYFNETDSGTNRQTRGWYCVRPATNDYPSANFNPYKYEYKGNDTNQTAFGYAWAYGEGTFGKKVMHASRGTCAMRFDITEDDEFDLSGATTSSFLFGCYQEGVIIGENRGQSVNVFQVSDVDLSGFNVSTEAFMTFTGYKQYVPTESEIATTDVMGSTEVIDEDDVGTFGKGVSVLIQVGIVVMSVYVLF